MRFFKRDLVTCWIAFFAILAGICLSYPTLSTSAEVFAEAGPNFFYHAYHSGFWYNIFEFDYYNYLILLPRLISLIAIKGFHSIKYFPEITQWSGLLVVAYGYACFNLNAFRTVISSDLARFLISLALGIGLLSDYELYAFINFTYHGMFLMLLLVFVKWEDHSRWFYGMNLILVGLIVLSKSYPVAFLPLYGLLMIYFFWRQPPGSAPMNAQYRLRSQWFYSVVSLLILVQAVVTYIVNTYLRKISKPVEDTNFLQVISDGFFQYLLSYLHFLVPPKILMQKHPVAIFGGMERFPQMAWVNGLMALGIMILLGLSLFQIKKRTHRVPAYFFIACSLLAATNLCLTVLSTAVVGDWPPHDLGWKSLFFPTHNRWFYLSHTCLFLGTLVLLLSFIKWRWLQALVTFGAIGSTFYVTRDFHVKDYPNHRASPSQWKVYYPLVNPDDYCIPINPYPWMIRQNCGPLATVQNQQLAMIPFPESLKHSTKIRSVLLELGAVPLPHPLWLAAYDQDHHEIGRASQLTPSKVHYQYFWFPQKVSPAYFSWVDLTGNPVLLDSTFELLGTE